MKAWSAWMDGTPCPTGRFFSLYYTFLFFLLFFISFHGPTAALSFMLRIPFELELSLLFLEGIYSYFVDVDGGECMIKPLAVAGIKPAYFVSLVYVTC